MNGSAPGFYARTGKRLLDLALVLPGLVVLSPLFAAVWVLVRCGIGSPVLFRQTRPGWRGAPFEMLKFRTMTDARDDNGQLLPDNKRLNALGRALRRASLDELPELLNVLRGEMSLVGPRPLLMRYLPIYTPQQGRRHEVRPGITGWAQVNGRNALSWEEKFALDVWYVDNLSLWLDGKILIKTLAKVVARQGVEFGEPESMPYFTGDTTAATVADDRSAARVGRGDSKGG